MTSEILSLLIKENLNFNETFQLLKFCADFESTTEKDEKRKTLIRVLEIESKLHSVSKEILPPLIDAYGLYPYLNSDSASQNTLDAIHREFHRSNYLKDIYFHSEQQRVLSTLKSNTSVILSAPTSFGKSLLIEEIIAGKKYKNIVIIQPTLALLDETRKKLSQYRKSYKILLSTRQKPSTGANIFLFTAERVVEYQDFPQVDFFVIDEFYKLSIDRDDERSYILNHAFYKLKKMTPRYYLLGPSIDDLGEETKINIKGEWIKSNFETVAIEEERIQCDSKKKEEMEAKLFSLLDSLNEPALVYCSSPDRTNQLSTKYCKYLAEKKVTINDISNKTSELIGWIDDQLHKEWNLADCLKYGIGIHHGSLPRHLSSSIVDLFNNREIPFLFCTSTLIEGVNTVAKYIVLFDKKKGVKTIDYFDFQNIRGRSGRMKRYFTGKIFNFHDKPQNLELKMDIPILAQDKAPEEILVQMEQEDLSLKSIDRLKAKLNNPSDSLIELIRSNPGIDIDAQLKMIKEIEGNLAYYHKYLCWTGLPQQQELRALCDLIWKFLRTSNDSKIFTAKQLAFFTSNYLYLKHLKPMIIEQISSPFNIRQKPNEKERINYCVDLVLSVQRQWFDYKLPKFICVVSSIQKYVFLKVNLKHGDYTYLAGLIENGFVDPHLLAIQEHGIPRSALMKLRPLLPNDKETDELLTFIRRLSVPDLQKAGLVPYEIRKIVELNG